MTSDSKKHMSTVIVHGRDKFSDVQYNRDSHNNKNSASRTKNKRQVMTTADEEAGRRSTVKLGDSNSEESCSGCSDSAPGSNDRRKLEDVAERDGEEMDKIISDLKNLFVEVGDEEFLGKASSLQYDPPKMISLCAINQLQKLTNALVLYRQNQQSANLIKVTSRLSDC